MVLPDGAAGAKAPVIKAIAWSPESVSAADVTRSAAGPEEVIVPGVGVERFVLQVVVTAAVQLVGSRLELQQDRAAAGGSAFRGDAADLYIHLLHGFHSYVLNKPLQARTGIGAIYHDVL